VGCEAGQSVTTATNNTLIGGLAGDAVTTGNNNVAVGKDAAAVLTTGADNTYLGAFAGEAATTGASNTFVGRASGNAVTTGAKNTILGRYNGNQGGLDIRTNSNNIVLSDGDGNPRGYYSGGAASPLWVFETPTQDQYAHLIRNTNSTSPYGLNISYTAAAPNGTSNQFIACVDSGGTKAIVRSNGGIANYQANDANLSDERVKTDIAPLGSMWDKFKALEIVTFKYKDQTHDDDNIGVIAQQVETVAPEFVSNDGFGETPEGEDPLKTIYTADMYHAAIRALQEAMGRIETLEAKVAALESN
jgi:hypothetical protein